MLTKAQRVIVLFLDKQRYALPLSAVERVVRMVEITPLPNAPDIVLGIIIVHGRIVPVFDIRARFGRPRREISLDDQLVIARTSRRTVALVVDAVGGVLDGTLSDMIPADEIFPGIKYVAGVMQLADGLMLIHDLDTFLSPEEEERLHEAIQETSGTRDEPET